MTGPKHLSDGAVERLLNIAGARPEPSTDAAQRIRAAVREQWQAEVAVRRFRRRVYVTVPTAAAAMIVIVILIFRTPPASAPASGPIAWMERATGAVHVRGTDGTIRVAKNGDRIEAASEVETPENSRAAFRLADGTSLRIDRASRVRFDRARFFTVEHGAIYIDSTRSGIEVRTRFGVARDVGTRFEVRLSNAVVHIRVRDGVVAFDRNGAVQRAVAGEQLEITPEGNVSRLSIRRYGTDWEWTMEIAPPLSLEGKTVAEFLQRTRDETGLNIKYRSADVQRLAASTVLHGSVHDVRPDVACAAILPTAGLRCSVHDGVLDIAGGEQ